MMYIHDIQIKWTNFPQIRKFSLYNYLIPFPTMLKFN